VPGTRTRLQIAPNPPARFCGDVQRIEMMSDLGSRQRPFATASIWASLVSCGVLSVVACHRHTAPAPAVSIETKVEPQPVVTGPVVVTTRITDASGSAVTNAHLIVEGDMSHPGMSPVFGEAAEMPGGRYQARLQFAMAGDWVLLLHFTLPGGQILDQQVDVKGVRAK
jgi:hypothetical protein